MYNKKATITKSMNYHNFIINYFIVFSVFFVSSVQGIIKISFNAYKKPIIKTIEEIYL